MNKWISLVMVTILLSSIAVSSIDVIFGPVTESNGVDSWWMLHHDPGHSGFSTSTAPDTNKTTAGLMWSNATGQKIDMSSPAVIDGMVLIGSCDGMVYSFNETDGTLIGKSGSLGGAIYSSPAVAHGKLFVGCEGGNVTALNMTTLEKLWSVKIGNYVYSSPAVADGMVFIGSGNGTVYALDENGAVVWNNFTGGGIKSSPAVIDGTVFIGSASTDQPICALNQTTGFLIWKNNTIGPIGYSSPAIDKGMVFIGSTDKHIYALDESNGQVIWKNSTDGEVTSSPAVAYDKVFVGSGRKIYALDEATGNILWNFTTLNNVDSSPAVADGKVFIGSDDFRIYALSAGTGALLWNYATEGKINSSPAVADGWVFAASQDTRVYAFGPNRRPSPSFTYSPDRPAINEEITFNASYSYDPDPSDRIASYTWDFGDGTNVTVPSYTITHSYGTGGSKTVLLTVTDTHEATNTTGKTLTVYAHDVRIDKVQPESYTLALGEIVNVNVTVKNYGSYDETSLNVTAYCTATSPPYLKGVIGSQLVDLKIGKSETLVFAWNTSTVPIGDYDISAAVMETEKSDGTVHVKGRDLAIKDIIPTPSVVCYDFGENVTIDVTVENRGDFEECFNITVYYGNSTMTELIESQTNELLGSYGQRPYEFQWNTSGLSVGYYTIVANVTLPPYDFDPTNNLLENTVQIRLPYHDVDVTDLTSSSYSALQGETLHFNVTVNNVGDYPEYVPVVVYANGTIICENETDLILKNASLTLTFPWNTTLWDGGYYNVTAFANVTDDCTLQNNNQSVWVHVRLPIHDVAIIPPIQLSKYSVFSNKDVGINATVQNNGNFLESFSVIIYANTTVLRNIIVTDLRPGDLQIVSHHWLMPPEGNYTIWANASLIIEENPSDNVCNATQILNVLPPIHDVAILNVLPSALTVLQNRTLNINITVQNQGAYSETDANVTVYANNTRVWSQLVFLDFEDTKLLCSHWNTTWFSIGSYTITANISVSVDHDPNDNNFTDGIVQLVPPTIHDVAVTNVFANILPWATHSSYPWTVWSNCTGIVYVSVENMGHFEETFNLTIYLDHDYRTIGDEYTVNLNNSFSLQIGEAKNLTVYCDFRAVIPSYYYITAIATPVLGETYTQNNNLTFPTPPDWYGELRVTIIGDVNNDGKVNMEDVGRVARDFGAVKDTNPDSPNYGQYWHSIPCSECPHYSDVTGDTIGLPDGKINMYDVGVVARHFGDKIP